MTNYNIFTSKTNWTLAIAILIAVGNAIVPFLNPDVAASVTTVLLLLAGVFHVNGVNKAAVASAAAGAPVSGQTK